MITDVWRSNWNKVRTEIEETVRVFPYIAIDTEFPGFLFNSPKDAGEATKYEDLKNNVNQMKLIQLGLTFSDANGRSPANNVTWQFNFQDFDPTRHPHAASSIELLKKNGIDFEKNKRDGIPLSEFGIWFRRVLLDNHNVHWIVFHGLYDLAYILKTASRIENVVMPRSLGSFLELVKCTFGRVYDVKYMARQLCSGEFSLERLGKVMDVKRVGASHQAGSDSLLTSCLFHYMKQRYHLDERLVVGYLFGVENRIDRYCRNMVLMAPPPPPVVVAVPARICYLPAPPGLVSYGPMPPPQPLLRHPLMPLPQQNAAVAAPRWLCA